MQLEQDHTEPEKIEIIYQSEEFILWSDITGLVAVFHSCFEKISAAQRKIQIAKILSTKEWYEHYKDKVTGRRVLSETELIEHQHELNTAICLAQINYDVIFAPKKLCSYVNRKSSTFSYFATLSFLKPILKVLPVKIQIQLLKE